MPRRMNDKADMAQMFGLLSLLLGLACGIPAIILGFMAISEIQRTGEDGTGKAKTGIILGFLSLSIPITIYFLFVVL